MNTMRFAKLVGQASGYGARDIEIATGLAEQLGKGNSQSMQRLRKKLSLASKTTDMAEREHIKLEAIRMAQRLAKSDEALLAKQ